MEISPQPQTEDRSPGAAEREGAALPDQALNPRGAPSASPDAWLLIYYDAKGDVIRSDYVSATNAVDAFRHSARFINALERFGIRRVEVCERTRDNEAMVDYQ